MITMFYIVSAVIVILIFLISVINLFSAPVLDVAKEPVDQKKLVSILIPARNEEKNISNCVTCCLNQTYLNKEIVVLDDNSTDKTNEILKQFSDRIKIIKGAPLPEGWLGKNWACHQLSQNAGGDFLLFIDADVILNEKATESAISEIIFSEAGMLSVFPTQIMKSFSERLVVPLMNWLLLAFLPLILVYTSKNKSLVAANGQFILWKKEIYQMIGGHSSVKNKIVEDMEFARICKSNKINLKTLLGGTLVFCRMYSNLNEALNGFSKNFFPGFKKNPIIFLTFISLIAFAFLLPIIIWQNALYSFSLIAFITLSRVFISVKSRQNVLTNFILHPFQMIILIVVGIISVYKTSFNRIEWKRRKISV